MPRDGQCCDDRVHHHVEQVPVAGGGDGVIPEVEGILLEESEAKRDRGVDLVDGVGVEIDEERGVGFGQELKDRLDEEGADRCLEFGGRGGEGHGDGVYEGEGSGDGDGLDAEVEEGEVEVAHGGEEEGGGVGSRG